MRNHRVISSYRYVFEQTTLYLTDDLALKILERFAGHPVQEGKGKVFPNRTVTFREFVRFLGSQRLFPESLTERSASSHWRPFHLQCNPCHPGFRPDFLLHLETSAEDALCFLDRVPDLAEEDYGNLYVVNRHPEAHSSDGGVRRRMFSQLSRGDVERVAEFYGLDMRMHGWVREEQQRGDFFPKIFFASCSLRNKSDIFFFRNRSNVSAQNSSSENNSN